MKESITTCKNPNNDWKIMRTDAKEIILSTKTKREARRIGYAICARQNCNMAIQTGKKTVYLSEVK